MARFWMASEKMGGHDPSGSAIPTFLKIFAAHFELKVMGLTAEQFTKLVSLRMMFGYTADEIANAEYKRTSS